MRTDPVRLTVMAVLVLTATGASSRSLLPPEKAPAARLGGAQQDAACAAFGPGFRKIEGSDTCVKIGGSVRVETGLNSSGSSFVPPRN